MDAPEPESNHQFKEGSRRAVYRLMKQNKLLYKQHYRVRKGKTFIKFRVPHPQLPFEHMEINIKYIWVHGSRRMTYLLSVIDIKTRAIAALYCLPLKVTVRSDNGGQFEVRTVRECLSEMDIQQDGSTQKI